MQQINNPLVSVIIAAYNEEKHINKCITSILNQTYQNIEVIIIDDGSSDSTLSILRSYNDDRINVFTQSNKGRVFSRNRALTLSNGKYIVFQDADDWSALERIEWQVKAAEKIEGKPVVGCSYKVIKDNTVKVKGYPENNLAIRTKMSRPFLSQGFHPPSILMLKSHLLEINGWRAKFDIAAEDGDLADRLYEDDSSVFYNVQEALYFYRIHDGSVTNKMHLTIPYQMFKRYCKNMRRSSQNEPETFEEYMRIVNSNIISSFLYKLEYNLFCLLFKVLY